MQAASDIFLGWQRVTRASTASTRDFYVRQLRDWKGSAEVEAMDARAACASTAGCAAGRSPGPTPAPATASPSPPTWAAGDAFDRAIADFAGAYADQNERDYRALVDGGRLGPDHGGTMSSISAGGWPGAAAGRSSSATRASKYTYAVVSATNGIVTM